MMKGWINIDVTGMFKLTTYRATRGHQYKRQSKKACRTDIGKHSFSQRVVLPWNSLPDNIVNSISIDTFKREYDKYIIKSTM